MASLRANTATPETVGCHDRRPPLRLIPYIGQLTATALFFAIGAAVSPVCWLLHKTAGNHIPASAGQYLLQLLFRFFTRWMCLTGMLRLDVRGLEKIRSLRGTVIVSNHPALLDAIFLAAHLPPTACVMRASLLRNPVLCGCALLAGYVTNDSGPGFVRQGIEKIRGGGNLLVFPEGTRTLTPPLNRFKNGFAMVATRTGAAVQTIVIEYHGSHLTKGVSLFSPAAVPLHFVIRAGETFHPQPGEPPHHFSGRIESWFHRELKKTAAAS